MANCEWKIVYSNYNGPEKRALELLNAELGKYFPGKRMFMCLKQ